MSSGPHPALRASDGARKFVLTLGPLLHLLGVLACTEGGSSDSVATGGSDSSAGGLAGAGGADSKLSGGASSGARNGGGGGAGGAPAPSASGSGGEASATGGRSASGGAGGLSPGVTGGSGGDLGGGGGVPSGGPTSAACRALELKVCEQDSDCVAIPTHSCCGPGPIVGLSSSLKSEYPDCYRVVVPQNCPPLGCSSTPTTDDGQTPTSDGSFPVVARCFEVEPGRKECRTTLAGSCVHNRTRCVAGDECNNDCGEPCVCESGFLVCEKPAEGEACGQTQLSCLYADSPTDVTSAQCTCTDEGWSC